ncbi:hypothetical protein [uncultured Maribacter sp.]|uniref:hypothetical protein n=1 Tax=uncultured Maribacter sp. TaxID=431308 RepID=UPI002605F594|nr:hypothetical protein [uncultured Maribacter sp.]
MITVSIVDKLNFIFESFKKNAAIFLFTIPFILVGSIVFYFATQADESFGMYVFAITFIVVPVLIILYIFPSSFMHYYEQALSKKYGCYTKATIVNKEIEDVSYTRRDGRSVVTIENYNYIITYAFDYKSVTYSNSFSVEDKAVYDDLKLQSSIPIKFLRQAPENATVLMRNLVKKK